MEFNLNKDSSDKEIQFALNYPGAGNIILCDDETFNKILYQPERSKREDLIKVERWTTGNPPKFMGYQEIPRSRCGALNTMET